MSQKENSNKTYMTTELQEHYAISEEPYEYYSALVSTQNGKGLTIVAHL